MKRRNRDWRRITRDLNLFNEEYQAGCWDSYSGKMLYFPPKWWHSEDCPNATIGFEPGRGFNGFKCPHCHLKFSLFVHQGKNGQMRDWSVHKQFDYSKQAADAVEQRLAAARRPATVNSLGDVLGQAIVASRAKNFAAENLLLLQGMVELLEKNLLGSQVFHACMREVPALLAEKEA